MRRGVVDAEFELECPMCSAAFAITARKLFARDLSCPACGEALQLTTDQRRILWFRHVKALGQIVGSVAEQD